MKKEFFKEIEIPSGVEASIEGSVVKISGPEGENSRKFITKGIELTKKENKIIIGSKKATKKEKKMINTITAHIKNMIIGVQKKFEYELKSVFSHFPITLEIKNDELVIKNFLGEKIPRKAKIPSGVNVEIKGNTIKIMSIDKELAGQTAANFETATKIKSRDKRVFQDGIFIVKKPEGEI